MPGLYHWSCCCGGGCPSTSPCSVCGDAETPLTIGVTLPAIAPISGMQSSDDFPPGSGLTSSYVATGTYTGGTFCLTQIGLEGSGVIEGVVEGEFACAWTAQGVPFSAISFAASSSEDWFTSFITVTLVSRAGPEWRLWAWLSGSQSGAPNPSGFVIFDTGWVAGTPPCGTTARTIDGLAPPGGNFDDWDVYPGEVIWGASTTGTATATPCCEVPI